MARTMSDEREAYYRSEASRPDLALYVPDLLAELDAERALAAELERALAASQAECAELRAVAREQRALLTMTASFDQNASAEWMRGRSRAVGLADEALSRAPGSREALRALLERADSEGFKAGMIAQQFVTGGYGVAEADMVPDSVRIARLLGPPAGEAKEEA